MSKTIDANARTNPRGASELDREIGARVRLARQLAGMSQTALGEAVGITFQQVQKYERGGNRIPSSRLHEFAVALGQPLSFFFGPEAEAAIGAAGQRSFDLPRLENMNANEARRVLEALDRCPTKLRRSMIEMILAVGVETN